VVILKVVILKVVLKLKLELEVELEVEMEMKMEMELEVEMKMDGTMKSLGVKFNMHVDNQIQLGECEETIRGKGELILPKERQDAGV
jgi:hypothetical protein